MEKKSARPDGRKRFLDISKMSKTQKVRQAYNGKIVFFDFRP